MKKIILLIILLLIGHSFILSKIQFTAWPEMFTYPYLVNHGFRLYTDFVHPYPPLLTMILAILYKIFGYNLWVLKAATWFIICLSDILLALIVKKLTKSNLAVILSLVSYVLVQSVLDGNQLWFDLAIVPFILLGCLLLINKKYFWAGIALSLSALTKQTTALFILASLVFLILKFKNTKVVFYFLIGPGLFVFILLGYLLVTNSLSAFLNWVLIYPSTFWIKFPGYVQMILTQRQILTIFAMLMPVGLYSFLQLKAKSFDANLALTVIFLGLSLVLVYPRFSFFHFQTAIAFISVSYGLIFASKKRVGFK